MVSSQRLVPISYILSTYTILVKAYRLGLWIFFHSLMKFFIDWNKRNYLLQTFFKKNISIKKVLRVVSGKTHGCEVLTVMVQVFLNNAKLVMAVILISVYCSLWSTYQLRKHKMALVFGLYVELRSEKPSNSPLILFAKVT